MVCPPCVDLVRAAARARKIESRDDREEAPKQPSRRESWRRARWTLRDCRESTAPIGYEDDKLTTGSAPTGRALLAAAIIAGVALVLSAAVIAFVIWRRFSSGA